MKFAEGAVIHAYIEGNVYGLIYNCSSAVLLAACEEGHAEKQKALDLVAVVGDLAGCDPLCLLTQTVLCESRGKMTSNEFEHGF